MSDEREKHAILTADVWSLYWQVFKDGTPVIVITDEEEFEWGLPHATPEKLILKSGRKAEVELWWDEIRFMAHDGFPAMKLSGLAGSALMKQLTKRNAADKLRQAVALPDFPECVHCGQRMYPGLPGPCPHRYGTQQHSSRYVSFGDPWLIEDVLIHVHNPGVLYEMDPLHEETAVLTSRCGAVGMLWDFENVIECDLRAAA